MQAKVQTKNLDVVKWADGPNSKMDFSFVLLIAIYSIPGRSFAEQDFADINIKKRLTSTNVGG